MPMIAVNLVGYKKSGKTTLALALGAEFKRRAIKAAAVKCTHHDSFDAPATDTARLREAYGAAVGLASNETAIFWSSKRYAPDLMPLLDAEVVVVEGGKTLGWLPRILLPKTLDEAADPELSPELALATWGEGAAPGLPAITDIAALADLILSKGFALPGLDCEACGRPDCRTLVAEIVAGKASPLDCKAANPEVRVTVNGYVLPMNDFVQRIFGAAVRGMLSECKGYVAGEIEIKMQG